MPLYRYMYKWTTNEPLLVTVGVSPEYDEAKTDLKAAERGLEEYLDRQRQRLGCRVSDSGNPSESAESAFFYRLFYSLGISASNIETLQNHAVIKY